MKKMKLKARQKSFKKNGQDVIFQEVYAVVEPVKGHPLEIVLSFDPTARQVICNNLEIAELKCESASFVNDNGEVIYYDNIHVECGAFDLKPKKKVSEAEKYLIKMANGLIK